MRSHFHIAVHSRYPSLISCIQIPSTITFRDGGWVLHLKTEICCSQAIAFETYLISGGFFFSPVVVERKHTYFFNSLAIKSTIVVGN